MTALELFKAKRDYEARLRSMSAHRYAADISFRSAYPEDLGFRFDPTTMDLPHEEVGRRLRFLEDKILLVEKYLAREELSSDELSALCSEPEALEQLRREYFPIRKEIPLGLVIMTFDDSTVDHCTKAAPILEKFGAHGVFFTCEAEVGMDGGTGFSDKSRYMTWEQIVELSRCGHEIANHSLHHRFDFLQLSEDEKRAEVKGLEQRCSDAGISASGVFGYPGGACDPESMALLHSLGYRWARGDLVCSSRIGQNCYDPLADNPMAVPGFNGAPMFEEQQLERVVKQASGGRVAVLSYHGVDNGDFGKLGLEDQLRYIYSMGGRCITFRELEEYVDPVKAYEYHAL